METQEMDIQNILIQSNESRLDRLSNISKMGKAPTPKSALKTSTVRAPAYNDENEAPQTPNKRNVATILTTPLSLFNKKRASASFTPSAATPVAASVIQNVPNTSDRTLWSKSSGQHSLSSMGNTEVQRQEAISEFIKTEQSFVTNLRDMDEIYTPHFYSGKYNLGSREINAIFGNFRALEPLHSHFLSALRDRQSLKEDMSIDIISDIVLPFLTKCYLYTQYSGNQHRMEAQVAKLIASNHPILSAFVLPRPCKLHLRLGDDLVLPTTRIIQYKLLIQRIVENTPAGHVDFEGTQRMMSAIESLLHEINEEKRRQEYMDQLVALQASTDFGTRQITFLPTPNVRIHRISSVLLVRDIATKKCREMLIMRIDSRLFLLLKQAEGEKGNKTHKLLFDPIDVANVTTVNIPDNGNGRRGLFELRIHDPRELLIIQTTRMEDKTQWMRILGETKMECSVAESIQFSTCTGEDSSAVLTMVDGSIALFEHETAVFNGRTRIQTMKNGAWELVGAGNLTLIHHEVSNKTRAIFITDQAKEAASCVASISAWIVPKMVNKRERTREVMIALPIAHDTIGSYLITCQTGPLADELHQIINKYKSSDEIIVV